MGIREIFGLKRAEPEVAAPPIQAQEFSITEAVHRAVADRPGATTDKSKAASELADKLLPLIDEALKSPEGKDPVAAAQDREELETHASELQKLAQQPELPPDGDNPAA